MKKVFTIMMTLSRPSQARKALTRRRLKASRGGLPMWNISTRTAAFCIQPRCLEATRVMFCRICYPAVSNIRICDPKNIPLKSASNLNGNLNCSKELEHYAS